ncbi:sulfatase family protein [Ruania alba]|uniref:Arylsulfatase A n=1 Tax=Ruania alba TaxID=648782 RepID=A0A1H5N6F6_9MICO|nr:sulfatase [Ruania alba]SEE97116.1 Arylsulfatase A [Ruania alba]
MTEAPARRRFPNLVYIFSDQQSRDMVGTYGVGDVRTPNIDRLAADGVTFDHCVSSAPVCTPYRGMLLTGQHPLRNNCFENDRHLATDIGDSFAEVMRTAGYRNGYVGKWHLLGGDRDRPVPPGPDRHGFDGAFHSNNCHLNYDPEHAFSWQDGERVPFGAWEVAGQTDQALAFLDEQDEDAPFSLFVSYHPPHNHLGGDAETYSGFAAPEEFLSLYDPDEVQLRPTVPDNARTRRMVSGYLAMCSEIDYHVGRIMARLAERDLLENTIVIYTSDHGETFGAYSNHWHKSSPEDVSVRVPFILRLPGRTGAGRRSQLLLGTLDIMPTVLGLMGLPVPEECQGQDLSRAVRAGDDDAVQSVPLFYFSTPWRGVYTRRWTYSCENLDRAEAAAPIASDVGRTALLRSFNTLYDREEDPDQLYNLYGHQDMPGLHGIEEIQRELHALTLQWLDSFDDPFPDRSELEAARAPGEGRPIDRLNAVSRGVSRGRRRSGSGPPGTG